MVRLAGPQEGQNRLKGKRQAELVTFRRGVGCFSITSLSRETGCIYLQAEGPLQPVGLVSGGSGYQALIWKHQ